MAISGWISQYLDRLLARREPPVPALQGRTALPAAADGEPARRPGTPVWFRCDDAGSVRGLSGLAQRLDAEMPGLWPLVTLPRDPSPDDSAAIAAMDVELTPCPPEDPVALSGFLDRWQPAAAVLLGDVLLPATVQALHRRGLPVLGCDIRLSGASWMERWPYRPLTRRHLACFDHLLAEDAANLARLRSLGAPRGKAEVGGALRAELPVPSANEAERVSLSELLSSRPVWCAYGLPLAEVEAIAETQALALGRSHRLLLVIVPADPLDGPKMQAYLERAGLACGLRSAGDEPNEVLSAYVADLGGEWGLWLRLAPLAFVGGTWTAGAESRSPLELAALGSAILHGPETAGHATDHARLTAAGAARQVVGPVELATEIETLLAPDQAATLAHAAWEVSSAGDEAAGRLLEHLTRALDGARPAGGET
ncbi:3-deoxy-D-manno-octulosonic acid transferase [Frigidibacter sp. ROC022]|uniref:3-deoxy-D-manno-octulosonic acid transferase n=1 Tax=Frigidibacter sp. ROC022 TaxID=2971796 RepID=UPI00215AF304|nr:glycosyltransferase N-terminal domain-containing protein [Frigidibacter sp. ROC022]MCR8724335.1 hypothetical protein [Frigidibacter sp. ROC022]